MRTVLARLAAVALAVSSSAVQPDGKIVVAGTARNGGVIGLGLVRLLQ